MSRVYRALQRASQLGSTSRPSTRSFSSIGLRQVSPRGRLPEFTCKKSVLGFEPPLVEYTNDADEADEMLAGLRSKRVSNFLKNRSEARRDGRHSQKWVSLEPAVFCFADAQGVMIFHISTMKCFPPSLRTLLEDDNVIKQSVGAASHCRTILQHSDIFDHTYARNMVDLRYLSASLYPSLARVNERDESHAEYQEAASVAILKLRLMQKCTRAYDWDTKSIQGVGLEYLSERTWFNFLLGEALRRRMLVVGEEAAKEKGLDVEETRTMTELYLRERCTYSVAEIMPR